MFNCASCRNEIWKYGDEVYYYHISFNNITLRARNGNVIKKNAFIIDLQNSYTQIIHATGSTTIYLTEHFTKIKDYSSIKDYENVCDRILKLKAFL